MARTQRWFLGSSSSKARRVSGIDEDQWERRLDLFEQTLGIKFREKSILRNALTHSSYLNDSASNRGNHGSRAESDNERLEFLGDAVLELVISSLIYTIKDDYDEGKLTQLRSQLVNTNALAAQAKSINVPEFIRLGKGEAAAGGAYKVSINADCFEALIGAIYLDQPFEITTKFIRDLFIDQIEHIGFEETKDPKSLLQEISLSRYGSLPKYVVIGQRGREHDKVYQVKLLLNNGVATIGRGRSKKAAEQEAATRALEDLKKRSG